MAVIYVARSAALGNWASDVGLSKNVFKIGITDEPPKDFVAAATWAGESDWTLVKSQPVDDTVEEEAVIDRVAAREKMIDPTYYPRLKGTTGIFKVTPTTVQNHILVGSALAGDAELKVVKPKAADFANYLIATALR